MIKYSILEWKSNVQFLDGHPSLEMKALGQQCAFHLASSPLTGVLCNLELPKDGAICSLVSHRLPRKLPKPAAARQCPSREWRWGRGQRVFTARVCCMHSWEPLQQLSFRRRGSGVRHREPIRSSPVPPEWEIFWVFCPSFLLLDACKCIMLI